VRVGVALNPGTPTTMLDYVLDVADLILVMSVNPGFGGQTFIPATYAKLVDLKNRVGERPLDVSVDGGVKLEHCRPLALRGATTLVAGSAIFSATDPAAEVRRFRAAALSAGTP
jgi:ribulose-phosphate 3-epimerase